MTKLVIYAPQGATSEDTAGRLKDDTYPHWTNQGIPDFS
jgi:hypothetical protein